MEIEKIRRNQESVLSRRARQGYQNEMLKKEVNIIKAEKVSVGSGHTASLVTMVRPVPFGS